LQRIVTVRGDDGDAFSQGYLCPKAYGLKGLHEDPDRLRRPLRREGSSWREIGWEEAFELATRGLRSIRDAHGADAVATYLGNPNAHDVGSALYLPTFQRALGTRWRFSATSVDQLPKAMSSCLMFGSPGAFPIPDVDRTDFWLVLGANPLVSNGSLMTAPDMPRRLAQLRARGGRLVVVDPRHTETARIADQHLFIRPGTDAFFLFALVHVLFAEGLLALGRLAGFTRGVDEVRAMAADFSPEAVAPITGIAPESLRGLARAFARAPRAACYGRIGTCTQEFGTLASWLVDVVNTLTGNLDRVGGVLWPRPATSPADERPRRRGRIPYARWRSRVRGLPEFAGELPVAALAEDIDSAAETERIRALVTVAGNPVLSTPNGARLAKALSSLEFMVSIDIYLNETTRFADLVLPPTGPLEHANYDLVFHSLSVRNHTKWSPAVFDPPADSKHQWQILLELAAGMSGTTAKALDDLLLGHLLSATVGAPQTACPELSPDEARRKLGASPGPDRVIDLMLRAGPFGDRFRDDAPGLSLAKLKAQPHGVDLGPMEPRLPMMLATESGEIELAHPLLRADTERLRGALAERRKAPAMLLIGRRHLRSNNTWMHNLPSLAKGPERCTLLVHPDDAKRIGLSDGGRARVKSRVGSIEAPVVVTPEMMPGVVSLPHGFGHDCEGMRLEVARTRPGVNSNLLADERLLDVLSGNAVLNGIPVDVSVAG
jgi:anaerobic selenocysteine-containing dehydrogenase